MYKSTVTKKPEGLEIYMMDGPFKGQVIGFADRIQMEDVSVVPGSSPAVTGVIRAVWGLSMDDSLNLDAQTLRSLAINKPFKAIPVHPAKMSEGKITSSGRSFTQVSFLTFGEGNEISVAIADRRTNARR